MLSEFVHQLPDQSTERLSTFCHHFAQKQPEEDAVAFGDMTFDTQPAALLATDQHITLGHHAADMLEADRHLVHASDRTFSHC